MIETIRKEKSIEKAVHEVVNLKYSNYISEQKGRIVHKINENNALLLDAPTGSGKTNLVNNIMEFFDDRLNIIMAPNVIQNKQNAKEYNVQAFTGNEKNIRNKNISATYDQARKLINKIKEGKYKFNLYIDECHLIVDSINFRERAIEDMLELSEMADKVIFMSATNYYMRDGIIKYDIELNMQPVEKRNNIDKAQIMLLDSKNADGLLINQLYESSKDTGKKTALFYNDIDKLLSIKTVLVKTKGLKDEEIAVIRSKDRTEYDQEVYDNIISDSEIPEQTKIILTTSVLEVGTNIKANNVNIFVYIPNSKHLDFNRIQQEVARFRVGTGQITNNTLKVCLPCSEIKNKLIKLFDKIKKELRKEGEETVEYITNYINHIHKNDTKKAKNEIMKKMLAFPKSTFNLLEKTSLGFIELDEENGVLVINELKLQHKAKQIFESQFYHNIPELGKELKSRLNVNTWLEPVYIKGENFKEEVKAIKTAKKDLKEEKKDITKETLEQIKEYELEYFFVQKVINPEVCQSDFIENAYKKLKDTHIPMLTREGETIGIEPQDMVNSFIENGDSKAKNRYVFKSYEYIMFNNDYPIGEEIPPKEVKKEFLYTRKVLDEVCKKQGRITQSLKQSLLIEFVKHNVIKGYKIVKDKVCKDKKNDSGDQPKPLSKKEIDKLVMPIIALVYNLSGDNRISSLKSRID